MRTPKVRFLVLLVAFAGLLVQGTGCSTQDPVGVRLTMEDDGRGTVAVAALSLPDVTEEIASKSAGVKWGMDARLAVTTGDFDRLDGVSLEDLSVQAREFGEQRSGTIRISIPCGKDARWFHLLHVPPSDRVALRKTLEHSINEIELHENITIAMKVSGARVAGSLVEPIPRVNVGSKNDTCTVVVPLDVLESHTRPMVLVVNWERSSQASSR